jgi:selenide,water dikinase
VPNLTANAKAAGCAAKLSPKVLDQVLPRVPRWPNQNVLVGFDTSDDAGVYKLSPELALVQTVDFFTPIVDDPYTFGAIAAANALSDVYAMGGKPITALALLCFPAKGDLDDLERMLRGGAEKIHEAGCPVVGGHSINEDDIKLGYSITGLIHPDRIKTNATALPGDILLFTKLIGTGVISTALKRGIASTAHVRAAEDSMLTVNKAACEAMLEFDVHACTDVTGFGVLGHGREMALASGVTLEIDSRLVRFLPGAIEYAHAGAISGGGKNNRDFVSSCVEGETEFDDLLYDPQTSGGLLISLPESEAAALELRFPAAYRIGRVLEKSRKPILLI